MGRSSNHHCIRSTTSTNPNRVRVSCNGLDLTKRIRNTVARNKHIPMNINTHLTHFRAYRHIRVHPHVYVYKCRHTCILYAYIRKIYTYRYTHSHNTLTHANATHPPTLYLGTPMHAYTTFIHIV